MRFMVQWASSSAATSPDPRSLFHSSVPEHSTTPDRGNISFSSGTPLVPALRRNRSSNASSSPPLVTGTPGASASGAATATPPVGKSASANARSATAAPLLSASHSFSSRGDDERLPARTRADPSAAAVAAAPCPHAAPGWGMPCSACLRRALEGGGAVPRSSSAEGRVQQRPAGAEEAGNGARAPEGKAGGRRGEGEGESKWDGGRKGAEKGGDGGARNGDRGEPMDQSAKGTANSGSRLAGELELATPVNLRPIKTGVSANAAASLASLPPPPSPPCPPSPPSGAMGLGGSLLGSAKSFARAFSFGAKGGPVTGAGGRAGMPRPRIGPSMSASELLSSVPSSTSAALQDKTATRQEPQRGLSGVGSSGVGASGVEAGSEAVGVGEGTLGKGEGESGGMGESRMGEERAVGGGEDGGREEGEVGSGKRGSGEESDGDERGGGEDHGGKRERGEGKRPGQEKDPGGGGEKQRRENGMVGGGEGGGLTGEEEDGEEEEGEKGNGEEEEDEEWAWATEAWVWAWGEGWEGRVACRPGSSSGPSLVGLGGLGGTRPSMATPTASRGGSVALSGSSGYSPPFPPPVPCNIRSAPLHTRPSSYCRRPYAGCLSRAIAAALALVAWCIHERSRADALQSRSTASPFLTPHHPPLSPLPTPPPPQFHLRVLIERQHRITQRLHSGAWGDSGSSTTGSSSSSSTGSSSSSSSSGAAWWEDMVMLPTGGRAATAGILLQPIRGKGGSGEGEGEKERCGRRERVGDSSRGRERGKEEEKEVEEEEGEGGGGGDPEGDEVVWRRLALFTSLLCFLLPLVLAKHMDRIAAFLHLDPPKTEQTPVTPALSHLSPHHTAAQQHRRGGAAGALQGAAGGSVSSPGLAHGIRQGGGAGGNGQGGAGGAHGQSHGVGGQGEEVAAAPFSKRLAYRVDVLFSTHSYVKSLALLTATLVLIAVGGLALYAVSGKERLVLADATWRAWTYVADAGNHADSEGVGPRVVSVSVSIGGMLVFALMVGLVSEGISEKVDSLRKGKSDVIEHNHTLILGWSDKLASLLKQLAVANESMGGGVVVVMAERDKEEMESEISKMEFAFKGTSVICRDHRAAEARWLAPLALPLPHRDEGGPPRLRMDQSCSPLVLADLKKVSVSTARSLIVLAKVLWRLCPARSPNPHCFPPPLSDRSGSPLVLADLKKVSVSTARSLIVLAEAENADAADARALRVVLSLTGVREGLRGHIVVELSDLDNEALVKVREGAVEGLREHIVVELSELDNEALVKVRAIRHIVVELSDLDNEALAKLRVMGWGQGKECHDEVAGSEGLRGQIVVELSDLDNEALVKTSAAHLSASDSACTPPHTFPTSPHRPLPAASHPSPVTPASTQMVGGQQVETVMVGGQQVETVVAHDVIGRLMIQCARQPGLAQIWEALLGFDNCEFYVKHWPQLAGKPFSDVLISFPDAVPCGVRIAGDGGRIWLNPDDDYVLQPDDAVLVVAEDDDSYAPGPLPHVRHAMLPDVVVPPKLPEKILFCGWRRDIDDMIVVLEAFLARGSELWIFCEVPVEEREERLMEGGLNPGDLENVALVHRVGNAVIRRHLESLPLETFDSILILADEGVEDSVINSDSRSLATLLLIRDIQSKRMPYEVCFSGAPARGPPRNAHIVPGAAAAAAAAAAAFAAGGLGAAASGAGAGVGAGADGAAGPSGIGNGNGNGGSWIRQMQKASQQSIVISEILDSRTRSLVAVSKISDYVLSNELVSMALAMISDNVLSNELVSMALAMVSEDREINRVLEELFSEEGNEMYIRPAELYLYEGEELSFFGVMGNEMYIRPAELYLYEGEELSFFGVMGNEMYIRPAELYLYEGEELSFFEVMGNEMYIRPAELYLYEGEELSFFGVMGNEMYIRPAELYLYEGEELSFFEVMGNEMYIRPAELYLYEGEELSFFGVMGNEMYIRPAELYLYEGEELSFFEVMGNEMYIRPAELYLYEGEELSFFGVMGNEMYIRPAELYLYEGEELSFFEVMGNEMYIRPAELYLYEGEELSFFGVMGNEMYIRPAELYLYEGEELSFFEVMGNEMYIRPAELYLYEGEELSFFGVMGNEMYIRPAELYLYEGEELSFFEVMGNEMYIRPAELYLYEGEELSFFEVMVRARQRLEIVIGYRLGGEEVAVLNPPNKSAARQWSLSDAFIVLSLEE
ncbi:unnamed protein product [Closterium sp. Naga37s-1]|nr:unnamed protein product [Closterium sp. Naga37s-1]